MNAAQVVVQGTLYPDGTLHLQEKPSLPAGPVEVLIRSQSLAKVDESWWEYLQRCREEMLAQGYTFRSKEEIDDQLARRRQKDDERTQALRALQTRE